MQMVGAFAEFERAMLRERTRRVWIRPVGKDASVGAGQNCRLSNRPRSLEWSRGVKRRPLMLPGYSRSILLPCRVYWHRPD
jgi:hypothetical protein